MEAKLEGLVGKAITVLTTDGRNFVINNIKTIGRNIKIL